MTSTPQKNESAPGKLAIALVKCVAYIFVGVYLWQIALSYVWPMAFTESPYLTTITEKYLVCMLWGIFQLWITARLLEKRRVADYGLQAKSFLTGLLEFYDGSLIGSVMVTVVTLILFALGCYHILYINFQSDVIAIIPALVAAALYEEVIFRGYVLQTLERASNTTTAVIVSSLMFGATHIANNNAEVFSCTALGLDAGLLFAAAYLYTRRLWLPLGIHAFWNIFEGPVFGTPVSGHELGIPLLGSVVTGPPLVTGGKFGPEASLIELGICLLLAWAMWQRRLKIDKLSK